MLGCLLFKKFKKFNESCSLSKAARMSSIFEKCCDFYPNNFKFCAAKKKKIYIYIYICIYIAISSI